MNTPIGENEAFPRACVFPDVGEAADVPGMTYRQWLIGQALAGAANRPGITMSEQETIARNAFRLVDEILVILNRGG